MKRLAAHYLFDGIKLIKFGVLEIDNDGTIISVSNASENIKEVSGLSFFNGILMPGMINMHCHLEFSDLQNALAENTGLAGFITSINQLKSTRTQALNFVAMRNADSLMYDSGVVAVADTCNTDLSIDVKAKSKIYYHSFIECLGIIENEINERLTECTQILEKFKDAGLSASISPHAIYSLHPGLFQRILQLGNTIFSLHLFESHEENELYSGSHNQLFNTLKGIYNKYCVPNINSAVCELRESKSKAKIFVHNVDVPAGFYESIYNSETVFPCLCPNSNLFISNRLPDINKLRDLSDNIVVGTDSLASNRKLSLISELYSISNFCPDIALVEMLRWVTSNGAKALGLQQKFGSFAVGTKPGVVLLSNIDLQKLSLTDETYSKQLV